MLRVYLSRALNYYLFHGKKDEMISTRCYYQHLKYEKVINNIFFWQKNHCRATYIWERRYNAKAKVQATKISTEEA